MTETLAALRLQENLPAILLCLWAAMSLLGAGLALYDKVAAKRLPKRRIPEKTLLLTGFFGGAEGMLAMMLLIRHKTKHKQFMYGLPAMILLHIVIAAALLYRSVFF